MRMLNSSDELISSNVATSFFLQQLRKVEALLGKVGGFTPRNKRETQDALKKALHEKVDGKGLASVQISGGHSILTNGTLLMKGRNFIGVMKIRGNLVSTKSRIARWHRGQDTSCESCGRRETLGHILQVCPRSWGERIRRHDRISAFVVNKAKNKGFQIWQELIIKTQMGMRKPDFILAKEGVALVLDTIICSDNAQLCDVNRHKVNYYNRPELQDWVMKETECDQVNFAALQ